MALPRRINTKRPKPSTTHKGSVVSNSALRHRKALLDEQELREDLDEVTFPAGEEPAFIRVGVGQTYNMGDFNSLRLEVSVTLPCQVDRLEDTYREASDFCNEKLAEEEALWFPKRGK
ncbi:hypothetical protein FBPa45_0084 [Pseudomonas phage vB_PaeS_FBPa45]|nr:hypothetical protein FBPa45_0084 [Pseudomonas phage vB_PaeS_FBPa45]